MKDNKLIAEFMEFHRDTEELYLIDNYNLRSENQFQATYVREMKFHSSWNWLMPVVEKCLATDEKTDGQHYFINDALLTCNIEVVYDRVVEFIKDCEEKAYKIDEEQNHVMGGVDFSESINQLNNLL